MPVTSKVTTIDKGWNRIQKEIKSFKGVKCKIGLFGEGDPSVNVAARGTVHQYGSIKMKIPKRPFMSMAFDENINKIVFDIKKEYNKMIDKKQNTHRVIKNVCGFLVDKIKKKITTGNFAPLKQATKDRKGSSKPLIDTAIMRNSVKYKIKKGI